MKTRVNLSITKESKKFLEKLSVKMFGMVNVSATLDFVIQQVKKIEFVKNKKNK